MSEMTDGERLVAGFVEAARIISSQYGPAHSDLIRRLIGGEIDDEEAAKGRFLALSVGRASFSDGKIADC